MSTVREVVTEAMQENGLGEHVSRAGSVINTLVERDAEIAERLIEEGTEMGASEQAVRDLLVEVGLIPAPVLEAVSSNGHGESTDDEVMAMLRGIRSDLDSLKSFARRNGYSG